VLRKKRITLLSLYNFHSFATRGFHSLLLKHGFPTKAVYFNRSVYTDTMFMLSEFYGLCDVIEGTEPEILAISAHSPLFPLVQRVARQMKLRIPECEVCIGGEHATAKPEECLECADYVVVGEGEKAILHMANGELKKGEVSGPFELENDLDNLPFSHYGEGTYYIGKEKPKAERSYLTGRGCPFACAYCQEAVRRGVHGARYANVRRKSVGKVMEDLKTSASLHDSYKSTLFSDSVFTSDRKWLEEFCSEYAKTGWKFDCYSNASMLDEDMIRMMKESGLQGVRLGVQSGSKRIRRGLYNRKDKLDDVLTVAELLRKHNISGGYDFIADNPYETREDWMATRDFKKMLPRPVYLHDFTLRWWPNTPLTNQALDDRIINESDVEGNFLQFGTWWNSTMRV